MTSYSIGLDYGTNSLRAVLFNCENGQEIFSTVENYPSGKDGVHHLSHEPLSARQNPNDYLITIESSLKKIGDYVSEVSDVKKEQIIGIGVGATGSTPLPLGHDLKPLSFDDKFKNNLNAFAWLWKDHTSIEEANLISNISKNHHTNYVDYCGGQYSSEWFWAKVLHCKNSDSEVFNETFTWVELSDYIPLVLTGNGNPKKLFRNACSLGHKSLFNSAWSGLPDKDFFKKIDLILEPNDLETYQNVALPGQSVGTLSSDWAEKTGLSEKTKIAAGLLDAHAGAIGSGVKVGSLIKIMGTSTCDCAIAPLSSQNKPIHGISGVAENSILPNHYGIEAGQTAVGDIFKWFVEMAEPNLDYSELNKAIKKMKAGQSGLLALDWHNGCRNVYNDHNLSGVVLGQNLKTTSAELYRALIEATAFGAKMILDILKNNNVPVNEIVCCGGLANKNDGLMQIYADVLDCPISICSSEQTCALGAAICGAGANSNKNLIEIMNVMVNPPNKTYNPRKEESRILNLIYELYQQVANSFSGRIDCNLGNVMKELCRIKSES